MGTAWREGMDTSTSPVEAGKYTKIYADLQGAFLPLFQSEASARKWELVFMWEAFFASRWKRG